MVSGPRARQVEAPVLDPFSGDGSSDQEREESRPFRGEAGASEPVEPGNDMPTLGVVMLQMLDWMSKHRPTLAAAEDAWKILASLCGEGTPTFALIKSIIKKHLGQTIKKIDVCWHCCKVAYYDCKSPELRWHQYFKLDKCPECDAERWTTDKNGNKIARRVSTHISTYMHTRIFISFARSLRATT